MPRALSSRTFSSTLLTICSRISCSSNVCAVTSRPYLLTNRLNSEFAPLKPSVLGFPRRSRNCGSVLQPWSRPSILEVRGLSCERFSRDATKECFVHPIGSNLQSMQRETGLRDAQTRGRFRRLQEQKPLEQFVRHKEHQSPGEAGWMQRA